MSSLRTRRGSGLLLLFAMCLLLGICVFRNRDALFFLPPRTHAPQDTHFETEIEAARLDINSASLEELMELPGIGEVLAARILEYREAYHGFDEIQDLLNVQGIGEHTLARIEDLITVGE